MGGPPMYIADGMVMRTTEIPSFVLTTVSSFVYPTTVFPSSKKMSTGELGVTFAIQWTFTVRISPGHMGMAVAAEAGIAVSSVAAAPKHAATA